MSLVLFLCMDFVIQNLLENQDDEDSLVVPLIWVTIHFMVDRQPFVAACGQIEWEMATEFIISHSRQTGWARCKVANAGRGCGRELTAGLP